VLFGVLLLGTIAVVVASVALRDTVREHWYLWRLETGEPAQKAAAATALGELGSDTALPLLFGEVAAAEDSELAWVWSFDTAQYQRRAARHALARIQVSAGERVVASGPTDPFAVALLEIAMRGHRVAYPAVEAALESPNAAVRFLAIRLLDAFDDGRARALEHLIRVVEVRGGHFSVRAEAAKVVASLGAPAQSAAKTLVDVLAEHLPAAAPSGPTDAAPPTAGVICLTHASFDEYRKAGDVLPQGFTSGEGLPPGVPLAAVEPVVELAREAPAAVLAALEGRNWTLQHAVLGSLRSASDGAAALVAALESPVPFVRRTAVWWLGELSEEDPAAVRRLDACAEDADPMVRALAVEALAKLPKGQ